MARSKKKPKRARRSRRVTGLVAASASNAVVLLNFEVKLPSGPNTNNVIIAGGADADRNGNVENNGEYGVFTRAANTFTYSQTVPGPVSGMAFYVQITAGPNVPYELTIKDSSGASRYSGANTTVAETEYIRWSLS